jgi:hypothetical protein
VGGLKKTLSPTGWYADAILAAAAALARLVAALQRGRGRVPGSAGRACLSGIGLRREFDLQTSNKEGTEIIWLLRRCTWPASPHM